MSQQSLTLTQSGFTHIYDQNGDGNIDSLEVELRVLAKELFTSINEGGDI